MNICAILNLDAFVRLMLGMDGCLGTIFSTDLVVGLPGDRFAKGQKKGRWAS